MKFRILFILLMLCVILPGISIAKEKSNKFTVLKGPYLGQKPYGKGAVIFLDGVISTEKNPEMNSAFTRDGKEFYYCTRYKNTWAIFFTREINGQWIKPKPIRFTSGQFKDRDFTISPDEKRIYFGSNRPNKPGDPPLKRLNVFYTERDASGKWSDPINVGKIINGNHGGNYPCLTSNGNLYFFTSRNDGIGKCDIYVSKFINERYLPPVCLSQAINSNQNDWDAYVAPDENYIIFSSQNRSDTLGDQDLYISYKKNNGEWTKARNMGGRVNSESSEICPVVTLDGKYLFFTSRRRGNADIYWVDAKIIEQLRSKAYKNKM